jgi:serine/threonine protein phosphatase PrpC
VDKKLLLLLLLCGAMPWVYGMEHNQLVEPKKIGIFSTINKRNQQEDFFYHGIVDGGYLYAVCDGHYCHRVGEHDNDDRDGSLVSKFVAENLHDYFQQTSGSIEERMKATFKALDEAEFVKNNGQCGSALAAVFIKDDTMHFAHVGDCRAILECEGHVVYATQDHKPGRTDERYRIKAAQGMILGGRVNGFLSISRALGDYNLNKNIIISQPDYEEIPLFKKRHKFLVLASDGLWKFVSKEEVINLLKVKWSQGVYDMNLLAKMLGEFAVVRNSKDNITVMLVDLLS